MHTDKFFSIEASLSEFTDEYFIDYERESIYIVIPNKYLDEIFKIINNSGDGNIDIVFVREFTKGKTTIIAAYSEMILFDVNDDQPGGDNT